MHSLNWSIIFVYSSIVSFAIRFCYAKMSSYFIFLTFPTRVKKNIGRLIKTIESD